MDRTRGAAGETMRTPLLTIPGLLLALAAGAGPAAGGQVSADYAAWFIGIPIGRGTLTATVDGASYRTHVSGRVTGIAALFVGGSGTAEANGRLAGTAPVPVQFRAEVRSGGKVETTRIAMAGGNVQSVERNPDKPPHPRATPVLPEHLRGVLDPLSAGVFIAGGSGPVTGAAACERRTRIYNGVYRFDLVYAFVATRQVEIAGYKGDAAICSVRFEPIAGFRADRSDIQSARRRSAELTLVPVAGSRALIPARVSLSTGYGHGLLEATRLDLDPARPAARPPARRASAD